MRHNKAGGFTGQFFSFRVEDKEVDDPAYDISLSPSINQKSNVFILCSCCFMSPEGGNSEELRSISKRGEWF